MQPKQNRVPPAEHLPPLQGPYTIIAQRDKRTVWKEEHCWNTMAAVLHTLELVVYEGPHPHFLRARTFSGNLLWEKDFRTDDSGSTELHAAGKYVLVTGRTGLIGRNILTLWYQLIDCRTEKILWNQTFADIGRPIFMDERTFLSVRKSGNSCFLERRYLRTRKLLFRHPFPCLLESSLVVRPGAQSLHVEASDAVPSGPSSFSVAIPHVYPVNAKAFPSDYNISVRHVAI